MSVPDSQKDQSDRRRRASAIMRRPSPSQTLYLKFLKSYKVIDPRRLAVEEVRDSALFHGWTWHGVLT